MSINLARKQSNSHTVATPDETFSSYPLSINASQEESISRQIRVVVQKFTKLTFSQYLFGRECTHL